MKYKFDTTPEKSKQMAKVHSKNGKDEVILRKLLWHYGVRYRANYKELPGKPDITITKYKVAVFVDGEFWHGYEWEKHKPRIKRNRDYWIHKIEYNMKHDQEVNEQLEKDGWLVLRFWSKQVLKNPEYYAQLVLWHINGRKKMIKIAVKGFFFYALCCDIEINVLIYFIYAAWCATIKTILKGRYALE